MFTPLIARLTRSWGHCPPLWERIVPCTISKEKRKLKVWFKIGSMISTECIYLPHDLEVKRSLCRTTKNWGLVYSEFCVLNTKPKIQKVSMGTMWLKLHCTCTWAKKHSKPTQRFHLSHGYRTLGRTLPQTTKQNNCSCYWWRRTGGESGPRNDLGCKSMI